MLKFLPLIGKNLARNVRRTTLTVLSVAVSLFLLGVLLAVYAAFYHRETPQDQAKRLVVRHRVSLTQMLPEYYGARIRSLPDVEEAVIQNWFGGKYIDDRPEHMFGRFAVEPERAFKVFGDYEIPDDQLEAFIADRQGAVIGGSLAERLGLAVGQRITIQGDIYPVDLELTIRGVFTGPDDYSLFFQREYIEESLPREARGMAGIFTVRVADAARAAATARAIDEMFRNAPEPTKTETESAFALSFVNQIGNIKLFLLSIAGAIVFTIMLVSANTMAMSVRERMREVGVLKTLGFTSGSVLALILAEASAVSLIGGALGVAGAYAATQLLGDMIVGFFTGFTLPAWGVPICLGAALAIGLASSLVPALSASHARITEALRHAG